VLHYTAILLDLDGTITDSAPGIIDTLAYTFSTLGLPIPDADELLRYVGPPLLDAFRDRAGMTLAERMHALEVYRERYLDRGAYDATLYPGMGELVRDIAAAGVPLSLATSKPELPATLVLEHFTIAHHFDIITGRVHDVEGAAVHGIPTIAVSWGYGEPAEFEHAIAVAHDVDELRALLGL
jgi:phosphoglycolate phosphatase